MSKPTTASEQLTAEELRRYTRHLILPEIGEAGQTKLKSASVLVIGAGGLGSPVALYLAAAGVGRIGLVDSDVVDESNLQRQIIHSTSGVGRSKIESARERLNAINPHVHIAQHHTQLTSENALEIIKGYDVIVDCTDNFPTRYLVNDACVLLKTPNVYGSVFRFEGQASVFDAERGPCYRCLYAEPPPAGLVPDCAEAGVIGVLPGIIGTIQANETIKLILGVGEPLFGRLLLFDALKMQFQEMTLKKNPDCPACGTHPTITKLIDYEAFCGVIPQPQTPEHSSMTVHELKARLDNGAAPFLLDVRQPNEHKYVNLSGTLIPLNELPQRISELDPSKEIIVYCHHGIRSAHAVAFLRQAGFVSAKNLSGGIDAWAREVEPTMKRY